LRDLVAVHFLFNPFWLAGCFLYLITVAGRALPAW